MFDRVLSYIIDAAIFGAILCLLIGFSAMLHERNVIESFSSSFGISDGIVNANLERTRLERASLLSCIASRSSTTFCIFRWRREKSGMRYIFALVVSGVCWFCVAAVLGLAVPILGEMWLQHLFSALVTALAVGFLFKNALTTWRGWRWYISIAGDFMEIRKTSANRYRDIETASHQALEL
jgi:hypothetical protein